ncbi:MAG: hypothetical protein H0V55_09170 [Thermoleophilaceae bacterium]|jgi:hypothetical protein|nr:hypothetical protein [Thermoleophilaceae bacterium]
MAQQAAARLRHPNRERASAKATKTVIALLLVSSAVLIALVLIGGWTSQTGARWMTLAYVIIYSLIAYFVFFQWKRGVLALSAGLALMFAAMVAPGLPGWFERTKDGYASSLLPAEVLGLLTVLIVMLQVLLVAASILGFQQGWDVEVEERSQQDREDEDEDDYDEDGHENGSGEYHQDEGSADQEHAYADAEHGRASEAEHEADEGTGQSRQQG